VTSRVASVVAGLVVLASLVPPGDAATPPDEDVVATVGNVSIRRADLDRRLAQSRSMDPARFDAMTAEERRCAAAAALAQLVRREVLVQEARRRGLVADEAEVARRFAELSRSAPRGDVDALLGAHAIDGPQWREETRHNLLIDALRSAPDMMALDDAGRRAFTRDLVARHAVAPAPPAGCDLDAEADVSRP
jgi:hypothetical protein